MSLSRTAASLAAAIVLGKKGQQLLAVGYGRLCGVMRKKRIIQAGKCYDRRRTDRDRGILA